MKQRTKRSGSSSVVSLALTGGIVLFGAGSAAYVLMGDEASKPATEHIHQVQDVKAQTAVVASAVKPTLLAASIPVVTPPIRAASVPVAAPAAVLPLASTAVTQPVAQPVGQPVTAPATQAVAASLVSAASAVAPAIAPAASVATVAAAVPAPAVASVPVAAKAIAAPAPAKTPVAQVLPGVAAAPQQAPVVVSQQVAVQTTKPAVAAPVAQPAAAPAQVAPAPAVVAKPVPKLRQKRKHIERLEVPAPSPEQAQAISPPKAELLPEAAAAAATAIAQREKQRTAVMDAPVAVNRIATEQSSVRPIDDKPHTKVAPTAVAPSAKAADMATASAPQASQYREIRQVVAEPLVAESKPSVVAKSPLGDKAWVRLGATRTVIVTKGQAVPGLGTFEGADSKGAKFDSGYVPISQ